jgi:hypothetical protein
MAAAGIVMTFAPFVDWGKFLPNTQTNVYHPSYLFMVFYQPIRKSLIAMS